MKNSRYQLLLIISLVALGIFFLTRLTLLVMCWPQAEIDGPALMHIFGQGALFDFGFCTYATILPILYLWLLPERLWSMRLHRFALKAVTFSALYALTFIAIAEYYFWEEFSVRFNFIAIDYLIYRREVTDNIFQSYPVPLLLTCALVFSIALYYLLAPFINRALFARQDFCRRSLIAGVLLLLPLISFLTLNQGWRNQSDNAYRKELASNGPYQFVAAFRNNELNYLSFYPSLDPAVASALLKKDLAEPNATYLTDKLFDIRRQIENPGPEKKLNVILVMVESLSADYLTYFGNTAHLTPNLDALIEESVFFSKFYATGTRTTRGLEAVTLSIPPTPGRSIVKRIGRETGFWSLGNLLNSKGYQSYFLYGGRGYFDNMAAFFRGNGYQVVDQSSVPDEEISFTNAWGMSDADLYRQAIKVAAKSHAEGKPFFLQLMTTSNHRPYTYPENKIEIPSGTGREGAVKYTDQAIGEFLADARQQPWFKETLFVIVADHHSGGAGKRDLPVERYHIPMLIYAPEQLAPRQIDKLSSQIDIAPTILSLLNMSYVSSAFGKDLLATSSDRPRALIGNYQNLGMFDGKSLAILSPQSRMRLQADVNSADSTEQEAQKSDSLIQRNISFYQGAAYIYQNRLNAWPPEDIDVVYAGAGGQGVRHEL